MQMLFPFLLILLSGGLFVMFIDPTYQGIKDKQIEKSRYDEVLKKTVEIRELRNAVQQNYNAIDQAGFDRLSKMLPSHIDNIRLILDINSVAQSRGMNIRNIRIDLQQSDSSDAISVSDAGLYGSVGFRFTVVTTYDNFKKFLGDLANSLRVVDVHSVDIEAIQDEEDFFRFDVGISTYWLPSEI